MTLPVDSRPPVVGCFVKTGSPNLVEALGGTPLDFVLIDQQHAATGDETVESLVRAADVAGLAAIVRVPNHDPGNVNGILDAGADGLVIPQVETGETVTAIADAASYDGSRSFAMSTRAGRFGARDADEYLEILLVPQIESERGVANAAEIASHSDVDCLLVGPSDLALSLDTSKGSDRHRSAIDDAYEAATSAECGVGTVVGSESALERERERSTLLVYSTDIGIVSGRLNEVLSQ